MNYLSKEHQSLWSFSKYPPSAYRIFGFVFSKYAGSFNYSKNIVQIFSFNSNDSENTTRIENFTKLCQSLFKETNVKDDLDVRVEVDELNKITTQTFISNNICNCLQSLKYEDEKILFNTLNRPTFETYPLGMNQRLEFVAGVYLSHSFEKTKMRFYNNYIKMAFTHNFMVDQAGEDDKFVVTSRFKTPHTHIIEIDEKGQFWQTLETLLLGYEYQI